MEGTGTVRIIQGGKAPQRVSSFLGGVATVLRVKGKAEEARRARSAG